MLFITLNTSCQPLLPAKFLLRNQLPGLWELLCRLTLCFFLAAFKILSSSLTFGILIMMCLGVLLFGSSLFGTLCAHWTYLSISFTKLGKFSLIIFSDKFSISCFSFSPSGTPMIQLLIHLEMSQRLLSLSSFF